MLLQVFVRTVKSNLAFFMAYHLLLAAGLYPLWAYNKVDLFLAINSHHHPLGDHFFYYVTHLGSGMVYCLLVALLSWAYPTRRLFLSLWGMGSFVMMSAVVQFLKRMIFSHQLRPAKMLELTNQLASLHIVDPASVLTHLSFPSGHASTIFAAAYFLSVAGPWRGRTWYSLALLLLAATVAYSRVYLCQHFYTDVYVGAWIGGWTAMALHAWLLAFPGQVDLATKIIPRPWKKYF
jgi:membrane-associated phospholipid phosphatase